MIGEIINRYLVIADDDYYIIPLVKYVNNTYFSLVLKQQ